MSESYKVENYGKLKKDKSHFAVGGFYEEVCREQYDEQPHYSWPGDVDESGAMHGEHRNTQNGP